MDEAQSGIDRRVARTAPATLVESRPRSPATLSRIAARRRLLFGADLIAVAVALTVVVQVLADARLTVAALAAVPFVVLTSKIAGLNDRDDLLLRKSTLEEAPSLFRLATLYALAFWLLEDVLIAGALAREEVVALWVGLLAAMLVTRVLARITARRLVPPERCLVLGDPDSAARIRDRLLLSTRIDAEVVAEMPIGPRRAEDQKRRSEAWTLEDLKDVARRFRVDRIVVAPDGAEGERMLDLVRLAKALGVRVTILPRILDVVGTQIEPDDVEGIPVLAVRQFSLSRSSKVLKRGFDLICTAIGLLVIIPLAGLIALAVRLDSRGPVLFRQTRIGWRGEPFEMLKFRTMVEGADARKEELRRHNDARAGLFKITDDPRVTPVGRLLRRTSLDELPQVVHVLTGKMSLVGPRPLIAEEDRAIEGWHRRRLDLVPGITGPWQLLGPRMASLNEMIKLDCIYVANWSLWTDVKILMRTVSHVLRRRGT